MEPVAALPRLPVLQDAGPFPVSSTAPHCRRIKSESQGQKRRGSGSIFRSQMRAQSVDATPSGIKLFSKVVFMRPGRRFGLSAAQKSEMWRRWKAGQTLREIGRALGKEHSSIRCLVSRHGGFVPAVRQRSLLALTLREREEISRGLGSGSSIREIAKRLDRVASTVSREV